MAKEKLTHFKICFQKLIFPPLDKNMIFKNHLFPSTMKKKAKRLKKKKKDITLQARLVWFVKMRSVQLHMQKAVEPLGGVMLGSDSHADLCPHTALTGALHLSVSIGVRCPILSATRKSRHTAVLTDAPMAHSSSSPVHCSKVGMSQGLYMGKPP